MATQTHVPTRHSGPQIVLHWLSVLAAAAAALTMILRVTTDDEQARALWLAWHRQAGLALLLLLALRLVVRVRTPLPRAERELPRWLRGAAVLSHALLYLALVAVPLLGWALTDARAQHPLLFGIVPLPRLAQVDPDTADLLEDRHAWAAYAFGVLVALHAGAALWHHLVRRDAVLHAMWPWLRVRSRAAEPAPARSPSGS